MRFRRRRVITGRRRSFGRAMRRVRGRRLVRRRRPLRLKIGYRM